MGNIIPSNNNDGSNFNPIKLPGCKIWLDGTDLSNTYSTDYQGDIQVSNDFVPTSISGCSTWFDSSDTSTLYSTSAGPVTAVADPTGISGCSLWLDASDPTTLYKTDSSLVSPVLSPLDVAGCVGWWDASDISTLFQNTDGTNPVTNDGQLIGSWIDKSSGRVASSISDNSNKPTYKTSVVNSKSAILFDGWNDYLSVLNMPSQTNETVFIVTRANFQESKTHVLIGDQNPTGYGIQLYTSSAVNYIRGSYGGYTPGTTGFIYNMSGGSNIDPVLVCVRRNTSGASLREAGTDIQSSTTQFTLAYRYIGAHPGTASVGMAGNNVLDGHICEILIYSSDLSNLDRAKIESYLATKWGIQRVFDAASANGPVGGWMDKSGNNNHAIQASGSNKPQYQTNIQNNLSAISFSNASSTFFTTNLSGSLANTSQSYTVFLVCKRTASHSGEVLLGQRTVGCFSVAIYYNTPSLNQTNIQLYLSGPERGFPTETGIPSSIQMVCVSKSGSSTYSGWQGGLSSFLNNTIGTSSASQLMSTIGSSCSGQNAITGYIYEIILYDSVLSREQRARVEKYLSNKWGLADVHVATDSGGNIGYWADKSGNNRNAIQDIKDYRPSRLGTVNNLSAITFDGTNDYFSLGDLSAAYPNFGEVFLVFEPNNATTYELYQSVNNYPIYRYADGSSSFGAFTSTRATPGQIAGPTTGVHVTSMRANSSNMTVRLDGNVWHTQNGLGYNGGWAHYIGFSDQGSGGVGGVVMNGKIVEVISYNRDIGATDRARVEQYLAKKWGISNALHAKTNLSNDRIGYVRNKGSLNTAFSQINHHNRPRLGTLNGKTALDFTRSSANAYLQTPQQALNSTSWSFFVVYRTNSINTTVYTYGVQDALRLISRYPNNTVTYGGTNTVFYAKPLPVNTTMVESLVKSSGGTGLNQTKLYRYGVDCVATSTSGAGTEADLTNGGWFVLNGYNSPYTGQGYNTSIIGEFIAYDRALSNDERALVEKYLNDKWNIDQDTNRVSKPTDISGCSLWLDADDIDTLFKDTNAATPVLIDEDSVAYWADKVGGQDVIQGTVAARPTYKTNMQNGRSMIYFDGGDDLLSQVNKAYVAPCTLFVVCRIDSHSGDLPGIFTHGDNTGGLSGPGFVYNGSPGIVILDGSGAGGGSSSNTVATVIGLPRILSGVYTQSNTSGSSLYVNGNLEENFTGTGVSLNAAANRVQIGARTGGGQNTRRMIGYVAECIRYDRVLTNTERASVENYLSEKWGIGSYSSPNSIGSSIIRHKIKVSNKDAQSWIDRVFANGGSVSEKTADAVDKFCREIESAGLRKKFYRLNLFCGNDLQACLTPLYLGPDSERFYGYKTEFNTSSIGPPGFLQTNYTEKNGLTSSGAMFLLTGISPDSIGSSYTGHYSIYQTSFNFYNPSANSAIIGTGYTTTNRHFLEFSNKNINFSWGWVDGLINSYAGGLYVGSRDSLFSVRSYEQGSEIINEVSDAYAADRRYAQSGEIAVFGATSTGNTVAFTYAGNLKAYSIGQPMSASDVASFNLIMESFQSSLGRGLPVRSSSIFPQVTNEDTKRWIDNVYYNGGTVSSSTALAVNNFCNSIDAAGLRNKFYRLNLFCGNNINSCLIPLYLGPTKLGTIYGNTKDINVLNTAGSNDFDYSEINGLLGNTQEIASNSFISRRYLRTGLVTGSISTLNNNLHSAVYTKSLTVGGYPIGAYDGASTGFSIQIGIGGYNVGAFANSLLNFSNTSTPTLYPSNKGLYIGNYSNSILTVYEGRAEIIGKRDITGTPLNPTTSSDMGLFGEHRLSNGIALFNYLDRLQGYSIGAALSASDVQSYYDIMQIFQQALSRANVDPVLGSQFDSITNLDTRDWLTRVYKNGGTVSVATATAVQNFCNSVDAAGIRSRFYRLNLFCGDNLEACTVPLYRGDSRTGPQRGFLYDVPNNITILDYNESGILSGIKGNGSNKYLATGLGTDFTNNSSLSFGAFITSPTETAFSTYLGVAQNNNADTTVLYYRDGFTRGLDGTTFYPSAPTNSILTGHHIYSRTASNSFFHAWNGTPGTTSNSASSVRGKDGFTIHALNNDGTIANYGNGRISMYHIGLGLTTQQVSVFNSAIDTFNIEMGRVRPSSQFASVTNEDAKIWIDNVYSNGGTVSSTTASAINTLTNTIDTIGIRSKIWRMNLFCGNNLNSALVPLYRGPDRTIIYGTPISDTNNSFIAADYSESGNTAGLKGNGSNKYLSTGLGTNIFANSDRHLMVYETSVSTTTYGTLIQGGFDYTLPYGIWFLAYPSPATAPRYGALGDSIYANAPNHGVPGMFLGTGTSTASELYRNGDLVATVNSATAAEVDSSSIIVFAGYGVGGSVVQHMDGSLCAYSIGNRLTSAQVKQFSNALEAFNLSLSRGRPSNTFSTVVSNEDAKLWIDAVYSNGGSVSTNTANAVNTFCNSIDSAGLRNKFYRFNLICGDNLNSALVPLYKGLSYTGIAYGNPIDINNNFISSDYSETGINGGLKGNGSNKYLNPVMTTLGATGNESMSCYVIEESTTSAITHYYLGSHATSNSNRILAITYEPTASPSQYQIEDGHTGGVFNTGLTTKTNGFKSVSSSGLSLRKLYINGSVAFTSTATTISSTGTITPYIFCRNNNGAAFGFGNQRIGSYHIGISMTDTDMTNLYSIIQAFQSSLNRSV